MRFLARITPDAYTLIPTVLICLGRDAPTGGRVVGARVILCWFNAEAGVELDFFL